MSAAVKIDHNQLLALVRDGATNDELAAALHTTTRTLTRYRMKHPELNTAIKEIRDARLDDARSPCGTSASYARGCRCDPCTAANSTRCRNDREARRARLGLPPANPGLGRPPKRHIGLVTIAGHTERIEQAIAAGKTVSLILAEFGIDYPTYRRIREHLDEAAAS